MPASSQPSVYFIRSIYKMHALRTVRTTLFPRSGAAARLLSSTVWADVPMGPPDPIIGLNEAYAKDDFPKKVE